MPLFRCPTIGKNNPDSDSLTRLAPVWVTVGNLEKSDLPSGGHYITLESVSMTVHFADTVYKSAAVVSLKDTYDFTFARSLRRRRGFLGFALLLLYFR